MVNTGGEVVVVLVVMMVDASSVVIVAMMVDASSIDTVSAVMLHSSTVPLRVPSTVQLNFAAYIL